MARDRSNTAPPTPFRCFRPARAYTVVQCNTITPVIASIVQACPHLPASRTPAMRLLNTSTLELKSFLSPVPKYVILSHRWEDEEIVFEDVQNRPLSDMNNPARSKKAFSKVEGTRALAAKDGYDWVWIDSCCIAKSSSSELQEAINSMFSWYTEARLCYAYLSDVPDEGAGWGGSFKESKWFTRAWHYKNCWRRMLSSSMRRIGHP
jgi:hypothetical protein